MSDDDVRLLGGYGQFHDDVGCFGFNPECKAGKHRNCDTKAICDECDEIGKCDCACHDSDPIGG